MRVSQPCYTGQQGPSPFSRLPFLMGRTQATTLVGDITHPALEWQSADWSGSNAIRQHYLPGRILSPVALEMPHTTHTESSALPYVCTYCLLITSGCALSIQSIIEFYSAAVFELIVRATSAGRSWYWSRVAFLRSLYPTKTKLLPGSKQSISVLPISKNPGQIITSFNPKATDDFSLQKSYPD